ncbi:S9 family peptidase [Natronolimnobius baerhuensis]|uniref:Acyl-peptide hydrolase n=1 Tax=Natronolimnobius baerhuensis TaxID=253108 RepID=A0A202E5I4_9EURY|nr:prolyl oligopeptidase family serine peptidase [Natronolimnobius baerhuensis]OVE83532.1 hypothetical protein B2G88_13910 [Natronolimnobius baerhuensis]
MTGYPIDRYMHVRAVTKPTFGPAGDRLFFISDLSSTREIWELTEPGQWPQQRTFTDGSVQWYAWSPTGTEIAFGLDQFGDGRIQISLLTSDQKTVTKLTTEPSVVHRWGGWSSNGEQVAYAANSRQSDVFDIYVQNRNQSYGTARCIYEHDHQSIIVPLGWSPTDDKLLVIEKHSSFNTDIHLINIETGESELLTDGPTNETRYKSIVWGSDEDSLYLLTDKDANWLYLARLDLISLDLVPVLQPEANIKRLVYHSPSKQLGYIQSKNGYSAVKAARFVKPDEVTTFPSPTFPAGVSRSLTIDREGTRLGLVHYPSDGKPDVYTVEIKTGDITRWTDFTAPVPDRTYTEPEPVTYPSFDGLDVPSFYTTPEQFTGASYPAMIHLHGGPRSQIYPTIDPFREYYLEQGFARLEPNFRGSSGYGKEYLGLDDVEKRPDGIRDVEAAADWLSEKNSINSDQILLSGISYGGFLVLAAMTRWPEKFAGGLAISPIVDFETYLKNTGPWRRELREAEYGSLDEHRELLEDLSPITDVENIQSPLLIVHGENDSRIPINQVRQFAKQAKDQNIPVETLFIPDVGHRIDDRAHRIEICKRATDFFETHLL